MDEFPREHTEGVWLFNRGRYYEAHERWEEFWLKEPPGQRRLFIQMLIHAAVCLHHWARGNRRGLVLQWRQFDRKAETFPRGIYWGVNVALLRGDLSALVEPIAAVEDPELPSFDRYPLPQLVLSGLEPTPVAGPPRLRHCALDGNDV
jgi:hypothetical protein